MGLRFLRRNKLLRYPLFVILVALFINSSSAQAGAGAIALEVATQSDNAVELRWFGPGPATVRSYQVERSVTGQRGFKTIMKGDGELLSFLDTDLMQGLSYTYRVQAFTNGQRPLRSNLVHIKLEK